jgi:hypothetical protein
MRPRSAKAAAQVEHSVDGAPPSTGPSAGIQVELADWYDSLHSLSDEVSPGISGRACALLAPA